MITSTCTGQCRGYTHFNTIYSLNITTQKIYEQKPNFLNGSTFFMNIKNYPDFQKFEINMKQYPAKVLQDGIYMIQSKIFTKNYLYHSSSSMTFTLLILLPIL